MRKLFDEQVYAIKQVRVRWSFLPALIRRLDKEGQEALREADARIMARGDVAIPEAIGTVDTEKLIDQDVLLFGSQREALLEKWAAMVGEKDAK